MLYRLIKGTFKPEIGDLDGDSVRFAPENRDLISDIPRRRDPPYVRRSDGTINLRYEGIDALEKRQDLTKKMAKEQERRRFAKEAKNKNFKLLGTPDGKGEASGYILTKLIDGYGRPIVFAFTGCATKKDGTCIPDGTFVSLNVEWMKKSINFQMICKGYAYPLFYSTLADDLREAIKNKAAEARCNKRGMWPCDSTCKEVKIEVTSPSENPLRGLCPIFPKLWRRLDKYRSHMGFTASYNHQFTLDYFKDYLKDEGDRVLIISESRFTHLYDIVKVDGNTVKMCHGPENLIFY